MTVFTTFDIIFLLATLLIALVATYRGIVKELFSFCNWITALILSYLLSPFIANLLMNFFSNKLILTIAVRMVIFLVVFIAFILFTSKFSKDLHDSLNVYVNRFLGLFFGILKSILIFGFVYSLYNCFFDYALGQKLAKKDTDRMPKWYSQSYSAPLVSLAGNTINPIVKVFIDFLKNNLSNAIGDYKIGNKSLGDEDNLESLDDIINKNPLEFNQEINRNKPPSNQGEADSVGSLPSAQSNSKNNLENNPGYNKKDIEKMQRLIEIINN